MTRPLVLESLFDPLWLARLVRHERLADVAKAKERTDCQALHRAQKAARTATAAVVRLEVGS